VQVFEEFLRGDSLQTCYAAVAAVADRWLDVLDNCGEGLPDEKLLALISEKKTISKTLDDYEGRKATSLTTAERLADFLGADMVKDKGLNCNLIISRLPAGAPVAERAIPVAIFSAEPAVRELYLRKWLKVTASRGAANVSSAVAGSRSNLSVEQQLELRNVVDWDYYKTRLSATVQKIITIPAGMQRVSNPVPREQHPHWLLDNNE
jgi:DNA polymerase epsilon subunit 1